jgi:TATA-binding protein-associated factor Taf7
MCRAPLEDVREKQMPANILTPVSAEQMVAEEISYFSNAAHVQSITSSRHPKRCFKEALRVFGFTLLRSVAEYVHDENMPVGWYDDGESETESSDDENENEDQDNQSDQSEEEQYDDEQSEQDDNYEEGNRSDDEFNYAVRRVARVRDLRESIGN